MNYSRGNCRTFWHSTESPSTNSLNNHTVASNRHDLGRISLESSISPGLSVLRQSYAQQELQSRYMPEANPKKKLDALLSQFPSIRKPEGEAGQDTTEFDAIEMGANEMVRTGIKKGASASQP